MAAALGLLRKLGLDRVLAQNGRQPAREVALCIAMIVARVIDPASKLATARGLAGETASPSLGAVLGLGVVDEQELYGALDWLLGQQQRIETALARRHLKNGTLVLYDVTSTYFEGRTCPLAKFGYNRDGKRGKLQIVFGLLCTVEGCPVAVEVFDGNVGDPTTLASQIAKLKERFALERVVLIGDRGMITAARLDETIKPAGLDWITALRAPAIRGLVEAGAIQLSCSTTRPRRNHLARLSRRAADRLPQSACSPASAPASAASCSTPPSRSWRRSRPASAAPRRRCAARTRSLWRSAP